jgi:hypothetical protein
MTDEIASAMAREDNEAFRAAVDKFYRQMLTQGVPADEAKDKIHEIIREAWSRVNAKS